MVKTRLFREDLYFRLNVFPIKLPALRERLEDLPLLTELILRRHGAPPGKLTSAAARMLERYAWPGNVRELEHTLERALILAGSDPVGTDHLSFARPELSGGTAPDGAPDWVPQIPAAGLSLETLERELIVRALERSAGNKSQAARLLGLTRRTLYSRMERHGLRKPGEAEDLGDEETPGAADDAAASSG